MTELVVAETADLDADTLVRVRELLLDVFGAGFTAHDWEHTLGGTHVLVLDGKELIGHAALLPRRLIVGGCAVHAGYVESVGVRRDRRRRGHGTAMLETLHAMLGAGYDLGALNSSQSGAPFYVARGWQRWRGRCSARTPAGAIETAPPTEAGVHVYPLALALDPSAEITCEWRAGNVW